LLLRVDKKQESKVLCFEEVWAGAHSSVAELSCGVAKKLESKVLCFDEMQVGVKFVCVL